MVPKRCRETEIGNNEMCVNFVDNFLLGKATYQSMNMYMKCSHCKGSSCRISFTIASFSFPRHLVPTM